MKAIKTIIIVLFLVCLSLPAYATKSITLANGEWRPYQSKDLKHYGVASHLVTEAFRLAGYTVDYSWYDTYWKRAYKDVQNQKVSGSLLWSIKPERTKEMYYSDVVISGKKDVFFFLKSSGFSYKTFDDLKGKTIGGTIGYNYGEKFETAEKNGTIKVIRVKDDLSNFKILLKKRIDAFVCGLEPGKAILKQSFSKQQIKNIRYFKKPFRVSTYHLILSKKIPRNKNIMAAFNIGLREMKENGTYTRFLKDADEGKYEKSDLMEVGDSTESTISTKDTVTKTKSFVKIPLLLKGSNNEFVKKLQKVLKEKKYYNGPINGFFDNKLSIIVIKFQSDNDLTPDGIVGPNTRRFMGW